MRGLWNLFVLVFVSILGTALSSGTGLIVLIPYLLLVFSGAHKRVSNAQDRLKSTLMADEQVIADTIQKRPFALASRRVLIAITNSRIITIRRGLLGGFTMQDIQWKDLKDVQISENVLSSYCGSNLSFKHSSTQVGQVAVAGVDSKVASVIYAKAQAEEQAWEEKRRARAIEETRAAAGGVVVHAGHGQQGGPMQSPPSANNRVLEEIKNAKELLDLGAISDVEFNEMKSRILAAA